MLVYRESEKIAAFPLLIRSLDGIEGLDPTLQKLNDVTSVYGYAGPVTNADHSDIDFLQRFNQAIFEALRKKQVVTAFSRLHPILENHSLLPSIGIVSNVGWTVSIDLTLPVEVQRAKYRKDHKYGTNKARREGVIAYHDEHWEYYDEFLRLYAMTMQRVDADHAYHFDRSYFDQLREMLNSSLHLFVAELDGSIISAGLFTLFHGIVQFHLSGSDTEYLKYAASKVLIDQVRLWASSKGAETFHLGGGVGSQEDSLFKFKAGFSDTYHQFKVWKCVVNEDIYDQAILQRSTEKAREAHNSGEYFPAYRV